MLELSEASLPHSHEELARAITTGLALQGIVPEALELTGGTFPEIDRLHLDLSESRFKAGMLLSTAAAPSAAEQEPARIRVGELRIQGAPVYYEQLPVQLAINAVNATLTVGNGSLALAGADQGTASIATVRADLEKFLHEFAVREAAKQGIQIRSSSLELTAPTPQTLRFKVQVSAKMFIMLANLTVTGSIHIDDQLHARASELQLKGEGMIGTAANALLRPKFDQIQSRSYDLGAFALGQLHCREVRLECGESVHIQARFGS